MATTGRVAQARELMLRAAHVANESGVHAVKFEMPTRSIAFSTRQCCYAAQRSWVRDTTRSAKAEGREPDKALREAFLDGAAAGQYTSGTPPATWPSASILYRNSNGKHYLVFEFRRIASDPLWSEILEKGVSPGAPEEYQVSAQDIIKEFK